MTTPDWPSIKADYVENVETRLTLAEVAAKWGVPDGTVRARAAREGWFDERQQFTTKLAQVRQEKIIEMAAEVQAILPSQVVLAAHRQIAKVMDLLKEPDVDVGKVQKLTAALANLQKIVKGATS